MAGLGRRTHYRKHLTDSILHDLPEPAVDERIAKVVNTRGGNQFDVVLPVVSSSQSSSSSPAPLPQLAILPSKFHKLVWVKRGDYVIVQMGMTDDDDDDPPQGESVIEETEHDGRGSSTTPTTNTTKLDQSKDEDDPQNLNNGRTTTTTTTATTVGTSGDITGGIRFIITHILYKDQVKHLKSKGLWPSHDPEFGNDGDKIGNSTTASDKNATTPNDHHIMIGENDENNDTHTAGQELIHRDDGDNGVQNDDGDDDGIVYNEYYDYDENNDDDLFVNTNRLSRLEVQDSDSDSSDEDDD